MGINEKGYYRKITLESRFKQWSEEDCAVEELYSLWKLLKKRMEDKLIHSQSIFVNFSLHDGSHSKSIIHAIERFLGEERIYKLSATDIFMLLVCAYAHDYGMAQAFNRIYDILGSSEFEEFLYTMHESKQTLDKEDSKAIENLVKYLNGEKGKISIQDMYYSILLVLQLYLRPFHWKGVIDIKDEFEGLFSGYLKNRFIQGTEGIIEICMAHGKSFKDLFKFSPKADGIIGDDFHPRFIGAMIRLGDLLDIDNNRFPQWFAREVANNTKLIPRLSVAHYRKHEAISHILITEKRIEIYADCHYEEGGDGTASLVNEWTEWIEEECKKLVLKWDEIAQPDFGRPPSKVSIKITVDGKPYMAENKRLQMQMSQERVMKLLEGTSIYGDRYVGIREIIQNAVDASLLQCWYDILHNQYLAYSLSKNTANQGLDILDFTKEKRYEIFGKYDIRIEVIKDLQNQRVYVIVKDKGIGIALSDVKYISDIGASREKNERIKKISQQMPKWMKPSGIFGIGLQSVFQITDCIQLYTRQHNEPERLISLYSYGKSRGKIEIQDVPENKDGVYFENSIPGTNVKIAIEPHKLLDCHGKYDFIYYDGEFDKGNDLDMIFAEISKACTEKIKSIKCDYFNIFYRSIVIGADGILQKKSEEKCLRKSFFTVKDKKRGEMRLGFGESIESLINQEGVPYKFVENMAYYWNRNEKRCYRLKVRPCQIIEKENGKQVFLPEVIANPYHISYKFNPILKADSIYCQSEDRSRPHAGFLEWNIEILDDKPTKYLNIDRERLRDGAISEINLLQIRKEILNKWCAFLCEKQSEKNSTIFVNNKELFLSFVFMFYQDVPRELFDEFIEKYKHVISNEKMYVGQEMIPVEDLWDLKKEFLAEIDVPKKFMAFSSAEEEKEYIRISADTVNHFPHRLVRVQEIFNSRESKLLYGFRLQGSYEKKMNEGIKMNEAARLYDHMISFYSFYYHLLLIDYSTIQKKVFKPNSMFESIILPCYPHTFCKGRNFRQKMDHCIENYILSPFDNESSSLIKRSVEKEEDLREELEQQILDSEQLRKCVAYIQEKSLFQEKEEKLIQNTYIRFIRDFYEIIYMHRGLIKEQFDIKKY